MPFRIIFLPYILEQDVEKWPTLFPTLRGCDGKNFSLRHHPKVPSAMLLSSLNHKPQINNVQL